MATCHTLGPYGPKGVGCDERVADPVVGWGYGYVSVARMVVISPGLERITDVIKSTLPRERPLNIREFIEIAARVRDGLRAGHIEV
jgi:hypothetical protein